MTGNSDRPRSYDMFVSYSHADTTFVHWLAEQLRDADISVWLDAIELEVGDSLHRSIEAGIENSRFFCFVMSEASLASYYVREVEFEQAFSRMLEERRRYILPISLDISSKDVPLRIRHLFRLDMSDPAGRSKDVSKIVRAIRGIDDRFTGKRWFKGLNITNLGAPVGVGPVGQMASMGQSYQMLWENGTVIRVDVFTNGKLTNYKEFVYDGQGRVVENRMYTPDGSAGWELVEDVWSYTYSPDTGVRVTKSMRYPGEHTSRVMHYDETGNAIREEVVTDPGFSPDREFGYVSKEFIYDNEGLRVEERLFDSDGLLMPSSPSSS